MNRKRLNIKNIKFFFYGGSLTGKPPPTVSWLANDKLTPGFIERNADGIIINRLEVSRVTREMFNATFKCQASNSKLTLPLEKTTRLELNCK